MSKCACVCVFLSACRDGTISPLKPSGSGKRELTNHSPSLGGMVLCVSVCERERKRARGRGKDKMSIITNTFAVCQTSPKSQVIFH